MHLISESFDVIRTVTYHNLVLAELPCDMGEQGCSSWFLCNAVCFKRGNDIQPLRLMQRPFMLES